MRRGEAALRQKLRRLYSDEAGMVAVKNECWSRTNIPSECKPCQGAKNERAGLESAGSDEASGRAEQGCKARA